MPEWGERIQPEGHTRFRNAVRRVGLQYSTNHPSSAVTLDEVAGSKNECKVTLIISHGDALAAMYQAVNPTALEYEVQYCAGLHLRMNYHPREGVNTM